MKSSDSVGVTFVNGVLGRGILHGVINLQLGVCEFNATGDGKTVDTTLAVACRLRMDTVCAQELYSTLGDLLTAIRQAAATPATTPEASTEYQQ